MSGTSWTNILCCGIWGICRVPSGQAGDSPKDVEKRLSDMAVLIKNVTTYQKTKPLYEAYRKARDKEKYRAEHERGIILHEAAAKALKVAQISGKFPSVPVLQAEYEKLQGQKEVLYADYGKLKNRLRSTTLSSGT